MYVEDFLATHTIFTSKELRRFLSEGHGSSARDVEQQSITLLSYHQKQGHIFQIRRGLYYTMPRGITTAEFPADPCLIAGKLAEDAVLAYNSALEIYGLKHSVTNWFYYLTQDLSKRRFEFQGYTYQPLPPPLQLRKSNKPNFGITTINREGIEIRITTLERTFVDILHRPVLAGEIEELWLSLEGITYLKLNEVIEYTTLLSQSAVAAKVGYFLESHKDQYFASEEILQKLQKLRPKVPYYFQRKPTGPQKLIPRWNLIVPEYILHRQWEEPHADI